MNRLTLIYDGECEFCKRWVDRIRRLDLSNHITFMTCQSEERKRLFPNISELECLEAMQAVLPNGRVFPGADAAVYILKELPRCRWIAFFFKIPGILPIARLVYKWIARNRHLFRCKS